MAAPGKGAADDLSRHWETMPPWPGAKAPGFFVGCTNKGPVDITSRGKRKFVLMTADLYDRLAGQGTQKAYAIDTMSLPEIDALVAGLDMLIDGHDQDDT